MNTPRITIITATAAVLAWAAKGVAIAAAGGLDRSAFEGPLFLVGLVFFLTACASLAVSVVRRHPWWARAGAVVAAFVAVVVAVAASGFVVDASVASDHWVWSELNLWVLSLAVLAVGGWHSTRQAAD